MVLDVLREARQGHGSILTDSGSLDQHVPKDCVQQLYLQMDISSSNGLMLSGIAMDIN